jgi:hypothetical protein
VDTWVGYNLFLAGGDEPVAWYETQQQAVIGAAEYLEVWGSNHGWPLRVVSVADGTTLEGDELRARIATCGI